MLSSDKLETQKVTAKPHYKNQDGASRIFLNKTCNVAAANWDADAKSSKHDK